MKTNIFAHGYHEGRIVSFGASRKGRIWSHEEANSIYEWTRWARDIGPTITDDSISLTSVMSGFLIPEPADERPPYVPISIELPHGITATLSEKRQITYLGSAHPLIDADLKLSSHKKSEPIRFHVVTDSWQLEYEIQFRSGERPLIVPCGPDAVVETSRAKSSLSAFLTREGVSVVFEKEILLLPDGMLLSPIPDQRLYAIESIETFDWKGVNIKRESQGPNRDPTSIQARSILALCSEADWDVVIDDDGTGELADIVLLRRSDEGLIATFVHCKFSSKSKPGSRIDDFYDVCGQAIKMNRSKSVPQLFAERLLMREKNRRKKGKSGIICGDEQDLARLVDEAQYLKLDATVMIVQPGLSRAKVSEEIRALLGGTERYLYDTHRMKLRVVASE